MKRFYIVLLVFTTLHVAIGQDVGEPKMIFHYADSVYGNLGTYISTGYLQNRTMADTSSYIYQAPKFKDSLINAKYFYQAVNELKVMATDSSKMPSAFQLYNKVSSFVGGQDFEDEKLVYPIGIIDMNYNWLDERNGILNGWIGTSNGQFYDNSTAQNAYQQRNFRLVAPLYDWFTDDDQAFIVRKEDFYSNYRSVDSISQVILEYNGVVIPMEWEQVYGVSFRYDSIQQFTVKVFYTNGDSIVNTCLIHTPELVPDDNDAFTPKSINTFPKHNNQGDFTYHYQGVNLKLKYCFIPSYCNPQSWVDAKDVAYRPVKPYILVTGYRPPIFAQSFKKTWQIYSDNHDHLLQQLRLNGYDVILVKFNMSEFPYKLGMQEAAKLFEDFLNDLNNRVGDGGYNENVIQGSSMGASVVNLALLNMENKHLHGTAPHPHSRLFISYDGNYYGANLPLAYQMQIYSGFVHPNLLQFLSFPNIVPAIIEVGDIFLKSELYGSMEQKATRELLMYHAKGIGNEGFFDFNNQISTWKPTYTQLRQDYLNALNTQYNQLGYYPHGKLFNPIPSSTRNIAISLGRYSGTNDANTQGINFNTPGENWRNINVGFIYQHILRAADYHDPNTSGGGKLLFQRKLITALVDEKLNVDGMQEVDNATGSYLGGLGNIITLTNIAYGFKLFNLTAHKPQFTHKPVLTSLAINPQLWPADGSFTLDMQDLGLMFNGKTSQGGLVLSNTFGYPNLGRPNDHFSVTPFEAIYVGEHIYPHIDLNKALLKDIDSINDFLKNEVEPWYLGLQNEDLGAQARSNYTYKALRRARNTIVVGHLVTPKTDPGDYVVEPNADWVLQAGEEIDLKPGVHIKAGAKAHLQIFYEQCTEKADLPATNPPTPNREIPETDESGSVDNAPTMQTESENVTVFPNPTTGTFTVKAGRNQLIQQITIYTISGELIHHVSEIGNQEYRSTLPLTFGSYLLCIETEDHQIIYKKLIVI